MISNVRTAVVACVLILGLGSAQGARAQAEFDNNFKFNSGQDVQPAFEGWSKNADGSFAMHFGYFNRNWVQELSIPVGPGNSFEPGLPDRGQPTFFYVRTQRNLFTVNVPKDWGKKELIWSLTANGKTQKAYGWLQAEWEIDPAGGANTGGQTSPEIQRNKPPTLTITAAASIAAGETMPLVAAFTDDGIPKPAAPKKPAIGQETPPTLVTTNDAPVNLPQLVATRNPPVPGGIRGPFVTWTVWRGPAGATFESRNIQVKDGKVQTSVVFSVPGEYLLRARASDRILFVDKDVKVTVTSGAAR